MTKSVHFRLLIWNITILAIALFSFLFLSHVAISAFLQSSVDTHLSEMTERSMRFVLDPHRPPAPPPGTKPRPSNEARLQRMPRFFDLQGHAMSLSGMPTSPERSVPWDRASLAKAAGGQLVYSFVRDNETLLRVITRPIRQNNKLVGIIQASSSYEETQTLLHHLTTIMLILLPCALVFSALGGFVLTDRALRPVRHIIRTAETLNSDDLSQRLPVAGTDEFAHLATTMNGMLSRVETAFNELKNALARERRFTSDASHELRTPLTVITANTTLALGGNTSLAEYQESMQSINTAAEMMRRLVDDLLLLARSDSGQLPLAYCEIQTADLCTEVMAMVQRDELRAPVRTAIAEEAKILWGDPSQLQRLLINLLENALRHTPVSGQVTLAAERQGDRMVLVVADTGEGIAPEHLPHLGERFYRIDSSRSRKHGGTGLGWAICKGIVEAHHGHFTVESTPGEGTTVRIALPAKAGG
ncbi:MAG: sensor histidine kinase [Armatimonadota bacterium]